MENKFLSAMLTKDTFTHNGAITNSTSLDFCLDLFFLSGACRNEYIDTIEGMLVKAYDQNPLLTLKTIFWAGDIRQGAGERRFFKIALNWLNNNHKEVFNKILSYIPEYSRWDVIFEIDNPVVLDYICENIKTNGLLCKWLPRKKQYNNLAKKIQKKLNITPKQYRKMIVENTKVVEQKMCANQWFDINYSQVPSVAMNKYNKAWYRHDEQRFNEYLEDVKTGKSKINASVIFPHDIVKNAVQNFYSSQYDLNEAQITQWNNLPNYLGDTPNSIIPVCDVSGSMYGLPIAISVGLGLYISERNVGPFKDAFITFSGNPTMEYLKGNINQRIKQLCRAEWHNNTDFQRVFDLILNKAIENNLTQEDLPKTVLVISDMEFDSAEGYSNKTNFEAIKLKFSEHGYKLPNIVFWNVNGRAGNVPVTVNDRGVALVSGASPSIIKNVLGNNINPVDIMLETLNKERYDFIERLL